MNSHIIENLRKYSSDICEAIEVTDFDTLGSVAEMLLAAKEKNVTVYTAGNGGSAATASHMCNDLLKGCSVCGNPGFKVQCLADSLAVVTCLANDFSYEDIFSIQLETKAKEGDLLIVFSGSGNSPNIVKAIECAEKKGMTVIGFTGRDGGRMAPLCDLTMIARTDSMEQIEDLHMMYVHLLSDTIQKMLKES